MGNGIRNEVNGPYLESKVKQYCDTRTEKLPDLGASARRQSTILTSVGLLLYIFSWKVGISDLGSGDFWVFVLMGTLCMVLAIAARVSVKTMPSRAELAVAIAEHKRVTAALLAEAISSNAARVEQSPLSIYGRFWNGKTGTDIVAAAKEVETCLSKRDSSSDQLLELLKPKVEMPGTGAAGSPLLDLTSGRPDTPQWIALQVINNQDNPYYWEYLSWIRRNAAGLNRAWMRTILAHVSTTSTVQRVREQCQECLREL
jgi:hypothetical protein